MGALLDRRSDRDLPGIGGAFSVVAANSWMNQPQGFTLGADGTVTDVEPLKVIFNPAVPLRGPAHDPRRLHGHRLPGRLGLRGRDAAGAAGPPPPPRPADPADGRLRSLAPIQFAVGDTAARAIAEDQPIKFAAMECVQHTHTDVTEYIGGRCTSEGVKGGIGIPGLDSLLVGFSTDTKVTGLDTVPPEDRPPANTMLHWAFDAMVGVGIGADRAGALVRVRLVAQRDIPQLEVVPARRGGFGGGGDPGARVPAGS